MNKHVAEQLTEASDGEVYHNYSGRGMFGKTTTGVVFQSKEKFYEALADVVERGKNLLELANFIRSIKFDSLGLGIIVY